MTPHDQEVFAQGALFGAALACWQYRQAFTEIDKRLQHAESVLMPRARIAARLAPVGWRSGQRLYCIRGHFG
jgi:hypothetical protein